MDTRNIYRKMQDCRVRLQEMGLKKSGKNKHANYSYFDLSDLLPPVNIMFAEIGLYSHVTFTADMAILIITNIDKPEETLEFTSPMVESQVPGCQPIQNLGAVETYQRRYLYMTALEIVEHDTLDAVTGKKNGSFDENAEITPDDVPFNNPTNGKTDIIKSECEQCQSNMTAGQMTLSKAKFDGRVLCPTCQKGVG